MQITHQEARKLIQFRLDQMLKPQEENTLQSHLEHCLECRTFFNDIKEVENLLLPVMRQQWDRQPTPLSLAAVINKSKSPLQASIILATRTAMISVIFAAFVFSAWQFTVSNHRSSTPMPASVLPIPTPSGQSTSTRISFQNCEETSYQVRENDTLESVAIQFSISKNELMAVNHLRSEALSPKMELLIPICSSTPTGTIHPSTLTTTFTPVLGPTTLTPDG